MAEKKYFWLKMPRNFFEKHYIKILRAKDNGESFGYVLYMDDYRVNRP